MIERYMDEKQNALGREAAVSFVKTCEKLSVEELRRELSKSISQLKSEIKSCDVDMYRHYVNIVYKGFHRKSELADALRYFYWGYNIREQEELLREIERMQIKSAVSLVASTKHFSTIMKFLYENGCSQQKVVSSTLRINKSNLSKIMNELVSCGLVNKTVGPKCVFYELTANGYNYFRKQDVLKLYTESTVKKYPHLQSEVTQIKVKMQYEPRAEEYTNTKRYGESLKDVVSRETREQEERDLASKTKNGLKKSVKSYMDDSHDCFPKKYYKIGLRRSEDMAFAPA